MAEKLNVLIADSDVANQCLYVSCFKKNPQFSCTFFNVSDGATAGAIFEKNEIDFVVIFYQLDDMSGLKLLEKIRSLEKGRFVPVIFTADIIDDGIERECRDNGAYEYLHLGTFSVRELRRMIHHAQEKGKEQKKVYEQAKMILSSAQFKANFLAVMDHEMKAPLNGMLGLADMMWETELTEEQREWVNVFTKAGEHILTVIDKIFEVNKIDSGLFEIEEREFDLEDHLDELAESLAKMAQRKELELELVKDEDLPKYLRGGVSEMRQVLISLVDNAVKFSKSGKIKVKVSRDPQDRKNGLLFSVQDSGIGISKFDQNYIFESYTQVDDAVTRQFGGVGLGLKMSKEIVERMGGKIWLESTEGEGSIFYFNVRMEEIEIDNFEDRRKTILVVDDEGDAREIMGMMLEENYNILEARDGKDGLELLERDPTIDLIISDMNMPGMNGMEMLAKMNELKINVPCIFLTGYKNKEMSGMASRLGVSDVLEKPLEEDFLNRAAKRAIERSAITKVKSVKEHADADQATMEAFDDVSESKKSA